MEIKWTPAKITTVLKQIESYVNEHGVSCGDAVQQKDSANIDAVNVMAEIVDAVQPEESEPGESTNIGLARKSLKQLEETRKRRPRSDNVYLDAAIKMAEQYEEAIVDAVEDFGKHISHMLIEDEDVDSSISSRIVDKIQDEAKSFSDKHYQEETNG